MSLAAVCPDCTPFTDLLQVHRDGRLVLQPNVHPLPDLLGRDAESVLSAFMDMQRADFSQVITQLKGDGRLHGLLADLRRVADGEPGNPFGALPLFRDGALEAMFEELHAHVMAHPVWRHPFFLRVFEGRFDQAQLTRFALHYFNQVKNTRQCVALSLGRFSTALDLPFGGVNERVMEMVQIVLAQLIADEYGVDQQNDETDLAGLLQSTTHIVMYRQLFEGLGVPYGEQDVPMLPAVADNVLTQRLVAGHPSFSAMESLASVGLGMEWGVPEFFSLLLGGMIRFAQRENVPLTRRHLHVFIAHVEADVMHAIAVMTVTALLATDDDAVERIKGATNTLMASRYGMMSGLYREVFGEDCAKLADIDLAPEYRLRDRRIADALLAARRALPARAVTDPSYRESTALPFVFA